MDVSIATMARLGEPVGGHFFSGGSIDRAAGANERRDPAFLAETLADPQSRFLLVATNARGPRLLFSAAGQSINWVTLDAVQALGIDPTSEQTTCVLLGRSLAASPSWCFALDASGVEEDALLALGGRLISGRSLLQAERADASIGGHALAMLNWHDKNMFSGVSGAPTLPIEAGLKRTGPGRGERFYPRIDVAVIMLVMHPTDKDRAMLGQYQQGTFFTCLAGFVEQGESIEEACRRETFEETVPANTIELRLVLFFYQPKEKKRKNTESIPRHVHCVKPYKEKVYSFLIINKVILL